MGIGGWAGGRRRRSGGIEGEMRTFSEYGYNHPDCGDDVMIVYTHNHIDVKSYKIYFYTCGLTYVNSTPVKLLNEQNKNRKFAWVLALSLIWRSPPPCTWYTWKKFENFWFLRLPYILTNMFHVTCKSPNCSSVLPEIRWPPTLVILIFVFTNLFQKV